MRIPSIAACLLAAVCATGASAGAVYFPYNGPAAALHGDGGTPLVEHGIEVWTQGMPSRPFRVIGVIRDSRTDGMFAADAAHSAALARLVRAHHGDALLLRSTSTKSIGRLPDGRGGVLWGTANYSGEQAATLDRTDTGFAVIHYE